jgi:uncharacterized protein (TIGR01244 family)
LKSILSRSIWLLAACSLVVYCGSPAEDSGSDGAASHAAADLMPNGAEPFPGVFVGGQPEPSQLAAASEAGIRTVINLRRSDERGTKGEQERVEGLGMNYLSIPITGPDDFDEQNARALSDALAQAEHPVMVHCGSGPRVGALFAMRAFYVDGMTAEEALEVGRAAGMGRYEREVKSRLEGASKVARSEVGQREARSGKGEKGAGKGAGKKGSKKAAKKTAKKAAKKAGGAKK